MKDRGLLSLARVRLQRCKRKVCNNRTRIALVVPLLDIGEGGTPGLGYVAVCTNCVEAAALAVWEACDDAN